MTGAVSDIILAPVTSQQQMVRDTGRMVLDHAASDRARPEPRTG